MKREHSIESVPFYEDLIFYTPLTESQNDLVGGKIPTVYGDVNYGENGAEFNESCLIYPMPYEEQKAPMTVHFLFSRGDIQHTYSYVLLLGSTANSTTWRYGIFMPRTNARIGYNMTLSSSRLEMETITDINTTAGTWYKVVGVFGSAEQRIYINDTLVFSNNATDRYVIQGSGQELLSIGNRLDHNYDRFFTGFVKDVRIYNKAMTDEEIRQL